MNISKDLKQKVFNKKYILFAPKSPGVYIYFSKNREVLYIGKALNLKSRLRSYLSNDLLPKTRLLIENTKYFSYILVNSEIEALLLEANLIKKYKPKYNISLKDDKNPLYINITNETYPRILTVRKRDLDDKSYYIGPFPSSNNVKLVLNTIRNIVPYSDHVLLKKPCFYNQIGLCNPCPNIIDFGKDSKKKIVYIKNIKTIKNILNGDTHILQKILLKNISGLSKKEEYENAIKYRDKLYALNYVTKSNSNTNEYLKNPNLIEDIREKESFELRTILLSYGILLNNLNRIECYDVAHISGNFTTGSMVTFINGEPDKKYYRHFKIKHKNTPNDTLSMSEIALRRKKHFLDWGIPDLMIIDGGKGQVSYFRKALKHKNITVIGISKRSESLVIQKEDEFIIYKLKNSFALNLIRRLRDEAHRFSRRYHHKLFKESLI